MAATWDRQSASALAADRERLVEEQLRGVIAPFSPYWRDTVRAARARGLRGLAALAAVPPSGERDVCPDGDPTRAAALVAQASEHGYAAHAPGPRLRRALAARLLDRDAYRRVVEADTRPTSFVLGGLGFGVLFASTRSDLDLVARAGARLWRVLGLGPGDVLVSALPAGPSAENRALELAALAAGAPALAVGPDPAAVEAALRLLPATVLAAQPADAPALVTAARRIRAVGTVLLVGAPSDRERAAVAEAAGPGVVVLAAHAPSGARLLWGECRESALGGTAAEVGFHTYPDLDLVEVADPETGEALPAGTADAELLLTQLGFRGSALVRWRTGDTLTRGIAEDPCPACGRRLPRVRGVRPGALVPRLALAEGERGVDLRSLAGAVAGTPGLADWRVVVRTGRRGVSQLLVHVDPGDPGDPSGGPGSGPDPVTTAVGVARDVRRAVGVLPTQVVVGPVPPGRAPR